MKFFLTSFFCLFLQTSFSQMAVYTVVTIPDSLKQNANAVVRFEETNINIESQSAMNIRQKRIVTVFNSKGLLAVGAAQSYDKRTHIKNIEATVYDVNGDEIKKLKRKDFRDQCYLDGITFFSDNRFVYLDYTPVQYPFTMVFESEIQTSNTSQIPRWFPLREFFLGIEKSVLNVTFPDNLGFRKKEFNFSGFSIIKTLDKAKQLSYEIKNVPPQKDEYFSVEEHKIFPWVMMGVERFNLEGENGTAKSWKEFGQWYSNALLTDTNELPETTRAKIVALVGNETDLVKKAKIVYEYVQQKSRYVSIQVGIGGFKPMAAKEVDRLGYGDCKALTNYTKALLNAVGVPSYHTILYGGYNKTDVESDFVSIQGNHMILSIPDNDKYIGLECTSQDGPFGYQANFTDDRNVLVIKPDGGEIVKTKNYQDKDNAQRTLGQYRLAEDGAFSGTVSIISEGAQYAYKYKLEHQSPKDQEEHYKEYWDNINNLKINKIAFANDKEQIKFSENIAIEAIQYGNFSGNKMLFPINAFNPYKGNIKRIRNRKTDFEIQRGSYDVDEISIALPKGFSLETLPKPMVLTSKFGEYKTEITQKDDLSILYKRTFLLNKGYYQNTDYEQFRLYIEQVERNDNAKIILIKT